MFVLKKKLNDGKPSDEDFMDSMSKLVQDEEVQEGRNLVHVNETGCE